MKELNNLESLEDLKNLRLRLKHQLKIQSLEAENSRLKMMQELDSKRLFTNISQLVVSSIQKSALGNIIKLFK